MGRAPCCEKVGLRRGRWTTEEDERLTNYILLHGQGSWRSLPKNAGLLRCGKSCRLRWINYLRSDLKRGDITPQEEDTIIKLHATLGNRWSTIAGQLPGRTDNEIKNYWNSHLSRRIHTIRKPNGEENVINLSNASAPPKRRGGRTSRAAMQRNKANNGLNNVTFKNVDDNNNPMLSSNYINNSNNNCTRINNVTPQLDSNLEQELLGIEDMMGLDGLLSNTNEDSLMGSDRSPFGPTDSNGLIGVGPIGEELEQCNDIAHVSCSISSNGGGSTSSSSSSSSPSILSCLDNFDGGISWDNMEIGTVDNVGVGFELCSEKEQIISWLWENDDNYNLGEPILNDVAIDVDFEKEQAMVAWLLS